LVDRKNPCPPEWTPALRATIHERDGHACRLCGARHGTRRLPVYRVDYDKQRCEPANLVTLCHDCHAKTNFGDRVGWTALFRAMLDEAEAALLPADEPPDPPSGCPDVGSGVSTPIKTDRLRLPVGLSFIGRAWSEPTLIRLAHAFEQGTRVRQPPR
jgi:hypothetical protein